MDRPALEIAQHFPGRTLVSIRMKLQRIKSDAAIAEMVAAPVEDELGESVLRLVRAGQHSIAGIADELDRGPATIQKTVDDLRGKGYRIELSLEDKAYIPDQLITGFTHIPLSNFRDGKWFRFGVVSDTHLCNKHARLDCLNAAYDTFEAEGIREVIHGGNWVDGEARFNKMELIVPPGHDNQVRYFLANYPKREGIVTRILSGDDHEGWAAQREGIDVGRHLEMYAQAEGRNDIINLGYGEADLPFYAEGGKRPAILRVSHPKSGSSYALSYKPQRTVESYDGGEKPQMLFIGHYHKAGYFAWRNVHTLLMGCLESQSYFMRGKQLAAHVGFWIIEFQVSSDGSVSRFRQEWTQFFDEGFYRDRYSPGDQPETLVAAMPLDVA